MIVAFLQNPWFHPKTTGTFVMRYRDNQEFHRRVLRNSLTGRRLTKSFGTYFDKIHWDNVNWRHTTDPKGRLPADLNHVKRVLTLKNPELVLLFGKVAQRAYLDVQWPVPYIFAPHPSAFGRISVVLDRVLEEMEEKLSAIRGIS